MAKDAELKKIELKVSVSCCDGCKRKVKKVLQSVEGVLKTEIDPVRPEVTVLGNVDPQLLIKKLSKVGKQAELLSQVCQNAAKEAKEGEKSSKKEKEQSQSKRASENLPSSHAMTSDKNKEEENGKEKASSKDEKVKVKEKDGNSANHKANQKEMDLSPNVKIESTIYPNQMPNMVTFGNYKQYPCMAEPYAVAIPCYAAPPYMAPLYPMHYVQEHYAYEMPATQPAMQAPMVRVGDYFSDENPVGCNVM